MFSSGNYFAKGCPCLDTSCFLTEWWRSQLCVLKTSAFYTPLSTHRVRDLTFSCGGVPENYSPLGTKPCISDIGSNLHFIRRFQHTEWEIWLSHAGVGVPENYSPLGTKPCISDTGSNLHFISRFQHTEWEIWLSHGGWGFLKITALWVQSHAYQIQVATYMATHPGIPKRSIITIYNRRNQAINWMHVGQPFLGSQEQLSFLINISPFTNTISLPWFCYSLSDY